MTCTFDCTQIPELIRSGRSAEHTGAYSLWIWARQGAHVQASLAACAFPPTHTGDPSRIYSWAKAGQVELRRGQPLTPSSEALQPFGFGGGTPPIGYVALSSDPRFSPIRADEVTRIFHQESDPLPDARLADVRHVNTPWTLRSYGGRDLWEARAEEIRRHILVTAGLWPLPEKTPLKASVFERVEREGYSVEKVAFECVPGFFVCGNLYRPLGRKGPFPGILCPHGHWKDGRLEDSDLGSIPGRCINLARQGHVAFSYDMAGYVDSDQIDHRGVGGPAEDLWGIGVLGLQLSNGIRGIDFLCSLDDVDPDRIGCTGASGGGTQTFLVTAVDNRIKVAAPVNMVSTHMQGGCNCENQANLRLDMNNVEIAAATAPRPLLLVSATGDWTCNTPDLEYPAVREIYRLYGAEDRIRSVQVDASHNYNRQSREAVYAWFGKWFLGIDHARRLRERPFAVEKLEDLRVFHNRAPPAHARDADGLTRYLVARTQKRTEAFRPRSRPALRRLRQTLGPAFRHAVAAELPDSVCARDMGQARRETCIVHRLLLGRTGAGDRVPALLFVPRGTPKRRTATLVVHPDGKAAVADPIRGLPGPVVTGLLQRGHVVLAIDTFLTGEFHSPFGRSERDTRVPHFATYNPTDTVCRIQDILTGLAYLGTRPDVRRANLLGQEAAGPWCLLARALALSVSRTAVDVDRFPAEDDTRWAEDLYIPGIRSAGDVRTAAALIVPAPLLLHNAGKDFPLGWFRQTYRVIGKGTALRTSQRRLGISRILDWLSR